MRAFSAHHKPVIAFTCDDLSFKTTISVLKRFLRIVDKYDMNVTFFAVPESTAGVRFQGPIVRIIKDACSCGHEVGLHGLHHVPFEMGVRFGPFDLGYALINERVSRGLRILREDLELTCLGFRAPYYQYSKTLLRVLNDLGFLYDSSEISMMDLVFSYFPPLRAFLVSLSRKFLRATGSKPYHPLGLRLLEIPVTREYTWHNLKLEVKPLIAVFKRDVSHMDASILVVNSHLGSLSVWGLEILKQFFQHVKDAGLSILTLGEIASRKA
ncbi:MAG: polysaccharide deacetylase family protein [Candidatus Bathyarchaeota archaeon]|nr:polysaccharide deacetylase family protein [Candidatus Bathyarchaeota archaeon]